MTTPSKPKIEKRNIKHVFTPDERAGLHDEFNQAYNNLTAVTAESKSVKDSYKAKETEAQSRMATLNATIQAGFEIRETACVVILDFKAGKKFYYPETLVDDNWRKEFPEPADWSRDLACITEAITVVDRQQDLLESEAKFEARQDIALFPTAGQDSGQMIVGRLNGKWFSALRVKIGLRVINERLDQEQPCSKKRPDQVKRTLKRFDEWLVENLGREDAKGFQNQIELVKSEHAEREE